MRGDDRRRGAPTRTRLLALRVLERVQRAGAFADLALNHALGHSGLSAPDRAFATELVYGTLRWGVICQAQVAAHRSGLERSVELAAIGRRICEVEWDLLDLIA